MPVQCDEFFCIECAQYTWSTGHPYKLAKASSSTSYRSHQSAVFVVVAVVVVSDFQFPKALSFLNQNETFHI